MAQRQKKTSRRQIEAQRRQDMNTAKQHKYTGPWKRRDRRRQAFQIAKRRMRIVRLGTRD